MSADDRSRGAERGAAENPIPRSRTESAARAAAAPTSPPTDRPGVAETAAQPRLGDPTFTGPVLAQGGVASTIAGPMVRAMTPAFASPMVEAALQDADRRIAEQGGPAVAQHESADVSRVRDADGAQPRQASAATAPEPDPAEVWWRAATGAAAPAVAATRADPPVESTSGSQHEGRSDVVNERGATAGSGTDTAGSSSSVDRTGTESRPGTGRDTEALPGRTDTTDTGSSTTSDRADTQDTSSYETPSPGAGTDTGSRETPSNWTSSDTGHETRSTSSSDTGSRETPSSRSSSDTHDASGDEESGVAWSSTESEPTGRSGDSRDGSDTGETGRNSSDDSSGVDAHTEDSDGSDSDGSDSDGSYSGGSGSGGTDSGGSDSDGSDSHSEDSDGTDSDGTDSDSTDSRSADSGGEDSADDSTDWTNPDSHDDEGAGD